MSDCQTSISRICASDAATNSIANVLCLCHTTTGTPQTGFGSGICWELMNDARVAVRAGQESLVWFDPTAGSETACFAWNHKVLGYDVEVYRTDVNLGLGSIGLTFGTSPDLPGAHAHVLAVNDGINPRNLYVGLTNALSGDAFIVSHNGTDLFRVTDVGVEAQVYFFSACSGELVVNHNVDVAVGRVRIPSSLRIDGEFQITRGNNQAAGQGVFGPGQAVATVNNAQVRPSSSIKAWMIGDTEDLTAKFIIRTSPKAGMFKVYANAPSSGTTPFAWEVTQA